jgi:glutaredoxin
MTDQTTITVYTREECHLCAAAIETIRDVVDSTSRNIEVVLIDIDDSELEDEYGERIPYVLVDGQPTFKYRVDENELRKRLSCDSV